MGQSNRLLVAGVIDDFFHFKILLCPCFTTCSVVGSKSAKQLGSSLLKINLSMGKSFFSLFVCIYGFKRLLFLRFAPRGGDNFPIWSIRGRAA